MAKAITSQKKSDIQKKRWDSMSMDQRKAIMSKANLGVIISGALRRIARNTAQLAEDQRKIDKLRKLYPVEVGHYEQKAISTAREHSTEADVEPLTQKGHEPPAPPARPGEVVRAEQTVI